jgi:putative transcription factor
MICDLCGKSGKLYKVELEGSRVIACESCAKYGKVLHEVKEEVSKKKDMKEKESAQTRQIQKGPEVIQIIVKDYSTKIKNAREKRQIKQEDFAKLVNIKDSLLLHIESGKMEPNMDLAHKLEKALGIRLIEEITLEPEVKSEKLKTNGPMTLGDLINIKKR